MPEILHDMPVWDFADKVMLFLERRAPIEQEYLAKHRTLQAQSARKRKPVWYSSQKQHLIHWFYGQLKATDPDKVKPFTYTRATANTSARVTYNRFLNDLGLLWLAETLGEEEATLRRAADAALEMQQINWRNRCFAFRDVIPWERVMELVARPEGWMYDQAMMPYICFDETGWPAIKSDCKNKFWTVACREGVYAVNRRRKST